MRSGVAHVLVGENFRYTHSLTTAHHRYRRHARQRIPTLSLLRLRRRIALPVTEAIDRLGNLQRLALLLALLPIAAFAPGVAKRAILPLIMIAFGGDFSFFSFGGDFVDVRGFGGEGFARRRVGASAAASPSNADSNSANSSTVSICPSAIFA